jgi:predicted lipoprotein with Yx(FWY)xxD motif
MQGTTTRVNRVWISAATAAIALLLAACGSDTVSGSSPSIAPAAQNLTVSIMAAGGIGNILVDPSGKALYTPDQEADGTVHCVAACLSYWIPLAPGSATPTAPSGAPKLGVISRPDGAKQVTAGGRPLYTFSLDSPGKVTGEGVSDDFAGQHFTWHTVRSDGSVTTAPSTPAATTPKPSSGPGYGY